MVFVLVALGVLVALVVAAVVLVPMFIDEAALIGLAQEQVRSKVGGELTVNGDAELSLFPTLALEINEAHLTIPAKRDTDQAVDAKLRRLSLGLPVIPTLRGNAEFNELSIDGIHARITAPQSLPPLPEPQPDLSDREWEAIGRQLRNNREAQRRKLLDDNASALAVVIAADVLTITDVTLEMLDATGSLDTRLKLERLVVEDINTLGGPLKIDTAVEIQPGEDALPMRVEMNGVVRVPSDFAVIDIDRVETRIEGALTEPVIATLSGSLIPSPMKFEADLEAVLPGGDVSGTLSYGSLESPMIDVKLSSPGLDLDRLQVPVTASDTKDTDAAPAAPTPAAGNGAPATAPAVPLPVGPLKLLDLALMIEADSLSSGGQVVENAELSLRVLDGVADLDYLRGTLHEGQLDTRATLNVRRANAELSVAGGMTGVNLDKLLASTGNPDTVNGRVDMQWDIDSLGATAEALKLGLTGDLDVTGGDVVVEAVSLQGMMCDAITRINRKPLTEEMPVTTPLSALDLHIDFADGEAQIGKLLLATQGLNMSGSGGLALAAMDFNVVIDTRLDNSLSELDPNCEVEERYAAVDWPIACSGNLAGSPGDWCRIDVNSIAEQLLRNEAGRKLEKEANKLFKKLFDQ